MYKKRPTKVEKRGGSSGRGREREGREARVIGGGEGGRKGKVMTRRGWSNASCQITHTHAAH